MGDIFKFRGTVSDLAAEVEESGGVVVLDLMASWCPSCRRLGMLLPRVAKENPGVTFITADVDENPELKKFYEVENIPVIKFLRTADGKLEEFDTIIGGNTPLLRSKLKDLND